MTLIDKLFCLLVQCVSELDDKLFVVAQVMVSHSCVLRHEIQCAAVVLQLSSV